jgi:hypothetical protein
MGLKPPVKEAESVMDWPIKMVAAETVVVIVGLTLFTVNGSQLLVAALLLASLLNVAEKP